MAWQSEGVECSARGERDVREGELARRAHAKITAHRKGTTQAHAERGRSLAAARAKHSHEGR